MSWVITSGVTEKSLFRFFSTDLVRLGTTDEMMADVTSPGFTPPSRKSALKTTKYSSLVFFASV